MTEQSSLNAFESDKPETAARNRAEGIVQDLRSRGGVFVEAVRATRMAMVMTDPALPGNPIIFANRSFLDLSGYQIDEVLGQHPFFMSGSGTDPEQAARFGKALEEDRDEVLEAVQYKRDGSRFVASLFLSAFKDENGQTLHHFLSWGDITRQVDAEAETEMLRNAQERLRQTEERFRALNTAGTYTVYRMSPDWRVMYQLNSETLAPTADPVEDWVDKYIPDEERPAVRAAIEKAIRTKSLFELEHRVHFADGQIGWVRSRAVPLLGTSGEIVEWFGAGSDITDRKQAEVGLRQSEEKYRKLFESMDEAYAVVEVLKDSQGNWSDFRFLEVNPAFIEHTAMPDPVGQTATELLGAPNPRWAQMYGQVVDTGEALRVEEPENALGRVFDLNIFALDRERRRVAVLFTDITQRKHSEEALRLAAAHDAYRVTLGDALRGATDAKGAQASALHILGDYLGASRVMYGEADCGATETFTYQGEYRPDPAMPSALGQHRWTDLGAYVAAEMRAGRTLVVEDAHAHAKHSAEELKAHEAAGVRAYIAVPLVREGRIAAYLAVNDVNPRMWTFPEVALAEETAQRIWAEVERARAKATAHEAEGRYLALYNAIDQGFCTIEVSFDEQQRATDYRFLEVSPSFERQTGIVNGAGRWMRDIAPDHDEHWFDIYGKVALTGESIRFENYSTPLDRWWSVYAFKIEGDARIAVLFHDITDRKRAEVALRTSKQQFETLLNQAPLGVYLVDSDFVIRQVNPIAAPVFGEMEEGPIGRDFDEVIHILWDKDYADELVRIFRQTLETGEPYVTAERAEHRNDRDTIEYYEWRLDRIILQDGRYGVVCYFRDISAQVHARLEIERGRELAREKEERLRLIVKNARDYAILTIDLNGIVTDWYEGAEAVFGWSRDEIVGKDSGILYTPKDREDRVPQAERDSAAEMGKAADVRWHVCKNGKAVFIEGVVTALPDANGEVSGFLKIGQDITDRKRSEEHQKLLLAELQHRVRNILAMIKSVVRRTFDTSETVQDYAEHLSGRIAAMARTQAILTRSAGRRVDLEGMIREELLSVAAQEGQFWCEGPSVALSPKAAEVLTLAIHELATNSIKYGALSEREGQLEIAWEVEERDGRSWLTFGWHETRVGEIRAFKREGFGTELITRRVPYELRGTGTLEPRRDGIEAYIEFPLEVGSSILETGIREQTR